MADPQRLSPGIAHSGGCCVSGDKRCHHLCWIAKGKQQAQRQTQVCGDLAPEGQQQGAARIFDGPGPLLLLLISSEQTF